jgi:hypothetical protein
MALVHGCVHLLFTKYCVHSVWQIKCLNNILITIHIPSSINVQRLDSLKILESWTLPCHSATTSKILHCESHVSWKKIMNFETWLYIQFGYQKIIYNMYIRQQLIMQQTHNEENDSGTKRYWLITSALFSNSNRFLRSFNRLSIAIHRQ